MKQFLLPLPPDREGRVFLGGKDYHYLARVRRLKTGDSFPALLPGGAPVTVRVDAADGAVLTGVCLGHVPGGTAEVVTAEMVEAGTAEAAIAAGVPEARIILFQAMPRSAKMDIIVRQAAEGALSGVVPFFSAYSQPRSGSQKTERWRRIIREARQQSGS
ncbi:MAG: 16S rRNA (uracil(1498)-N(3))-methyltransferase, partial [Spirochaetaceae bacterium]|nr:16S rRNA (uracil(1498)-N(3))-methyltransferase [Spirochaetaceae bacterium]